jgi:hypothetical protein
MPPKMARSYGHGVPARRYNEFVIATVPPRSGLADNGNGIAADRGGRKLSECSPLC